MSNFAKVVDGIVVNIIVAEQEFIDTLEDKDSWIETSNTTLLRKNYAIIGGTYSEELDAFIPPKPFNSWILNEDTFKWEAPISYPNDEKEYLWNEDILNWQEISE